MSIPNRVVFYYYNILYRNRMRKDRSCSAAGLLEYSSSSSPDAVRKHKEKLTSQSSSSKLRSNPHNTLVDLTIFHIPGMDVKLQYQSKVCREFCLVTKLIPFNVGYHGRRSVGCTA